MEATPEPRFSSDITVEPAWTGMRECWEWGNSRGLIRPGNSCCICALGEVSDTELWEGECSTAGYVLHKRTDRGDIEQIFCFTQLCFLLPTFCRCYRGLSESVQTALCVKVVTLHVTVWGFVTCTDLTRHCTPEEKGGQACNPKWLTRIKKTRRRLCLRESWRQEGFPRLSRQGGTERRRRATENGKTRERKVK